MPHLSHPDEGMVYACPRCDRADIRHRNPQHPNSQGDTPLQCKNCSHEFETPEERPTRTNRRQHRDGSKSHLEVLLESNPEIREEHAGFERASQIRTDGGTETSGTDRGIYLAGPVENDDSPRSWRDELRERYPEITWIDPMDWQDEWEDDPAAVWDRELETCRTGAVLVCNVGSDAPRTTGTHHEIREALNHDQPVAIVPEGDISQIYREIEDVRIFHDLDRAVRSLVDPEEIAADGGHSQGQAAAFEASSSVFDRWIGKAADNIDEWGYQREETLLLAIQEELGELTQAHLEANHEQGDDVRVDEELDDLGALLLQLHEVRNNRSVGKDSEQRGGA